MTVRWSDAMDAALIELRAKGIGYRAAGDKIGVADKVAMRRVKALGLPTWNQGGGFRCRGKRAVGNAA